MAARTLYLASALALCLPGLALAQARTTWREPERGAAEAPGPRVQEAQARLRDTSPNDRDMGPPQRNDRDLGPPPRNDRDLGPPPRSEGPPPRGNMDGPPPRGQADGPPPPRFQGARPRSVKSARYKGGAGSTWKTGRNSHGFQGTYGGCSYSGFAGPNGYKLNRNC